jgi:uncharacterized lipoprotein YddW (UPF0748 family)
MKKLTQFLCCIFLFANAGNGQAISNPIYEMRGVWVATVNNIDWPTLKTNASIEQKKDFIVLLDRHKKNGMNAVFVQVRTACDALYPSQYEPWSEYLSGYQGNPPYPYYDPLAFMIEETHKRGMEFHAWINPYRAVFKNPISTIAPTHISKIKPDWVVTYGEQKWLNPALPEVRTHVLRIVKDLISRYNIDGIHMDDYFYPYRVGDKDFPDQIQYKKSNTKLNKEDWRRSNCDSIIKQIWQTVISMPRRVKFGVSPFGVWRNIAKDANGSNTKAGMTNYDDLYADILLWIKNGWIDYIVPQLYWEQGHKLCSYDILLDWWNNQITNRHLYIGHAMYRAAANEKPWRNNNEFPNEIKKLRTYKTTQGSVYFSSKSFDGNPNGINDSLRNNYYATPALVPPMPWIDNAKPKTATIIKGENTYTLQYEGSVAIKGFAVFVGSNIANSKLLKIIDNTITIINPIDYTLLPSQKIFVATISKGNNLGELQELY